MLETRAVIHSERSLEGEILIDHSHSPGLTPEDLAGFHAPAVGKGQVFESATYTCRHCQFTVVLNPNRSRPREVCTGCGHRICDDCAFIRKQPGPFYDQCRDVERRIDQILECYAKGITDPRIVPQL